MSEITDDRIFTGGSSPDSESFEIGIAFGVVLFMTALGVWLMQPEASEASFESDGNPGTVLAAPVAYQAEAEAVAAVQERDRGPRELATIQQASPAVAVPFVEQVVEPVVEPMVEPVETPVMSLKAADVVAVPEPVVRPIATQPEPVAPVVETAPVFEKVEPAPAPAPALAPAPESVSDADLQVAARATENVTFVVGSTTLTSKSQEVLNDLAEVLSNKDSIGLRIVGHTDAMGTADDNAALSFARAEASRAYLIEKGIDAGRIDTAGFGELKPIASNLTSEGRERNRRVEFELLSDGAAQ